MKFSGVFLAGFLLLAGAGGASAQNNFTYTLSLPNVDFNACEGVSGEGCGATEDDSTFTQYEFSWVGPLVYNAAPDTSCPTVCGPVVSGATVNSNYTFSTFIFSGDPTLSQPVAEVQFVDGESTLTFYFDDPNSFWATPGSYTFGNNGTSELNYFETGFNGGAESLEQGIINCNECSLAIAATPEPASSFLLATGLAVCLMLLKRLRRSAIH